MIHRLDKKPCKLCRKWFEIKAFTKEYCSRKCKEKSKAHRYRFIRTSAWNKVKSILKCEICGILDVSEILEIHHMDHNRKNNIYKNLLKLCPNCHKMVHRKLFVIDYQNKQVIYYRDLKPIWIKPLKRENYL